MSPDIMHAMHRSSKKRVVADHHFTGIVYTPNGRTEFSGSNVRIEPGAIVAEQVKLNGSVQRMVGYRIGNADAGLGGGRSLLVE